MLLALVNVLLSPFCLLIFLFGNFGKENQFYTKVGTNVYQLNFKPYLIYCAIYTMLLFAGIVVLDVLIPIDITFQQVFEPTNYTISIIGWCVTGLTLMTYAQGMEGNIMGFIFFPLLALASIALIVVNIIGFGTFFWQLELPAVSVNYWIALLLHAFSPIYILLLLHNEEENEKEKEEEDLEEVPISSIPLVALIMQFILFGIHWAVIKVFGQEILTFSMFFGEGQPMLYYLPMLLGLLYWVLCLIDNKIKQPKFVLQLVLLLGIISIPIELLYYIKLIVAHF